MKTGFETHALGRVSVVSRNRQRLSGGDPVLDFIKATFAAESQQLVCLRISFWLGAFGSRIQWPRWSWRDLLVVGGWLNLSRVLLITNPLRPVHSVVSRDGPPPTKRRQF